MGRSCCNGNKYACINIYLLTERDICGESIKIFQSSRNTVTVLKFDFGKNVLNYDDAHLKLR